MSNNQSDKVKLCTSFTKRHPPPTPQWTHNVMITSLLRQNDVATSFRPNNDVIITPCWPLQLAGSIESSVMKQRCIVSRGKMEHGGKMEHRVFSKIHARRGSIFKSTWFLSSAISASCMEIKLAIDHVFSISQKRNFTLLINQLTRVLISSALTN